MMEKEKNEALNQFESLKKKIQEQQEAISIHEATMRDLKAAHDAMENEMNVYRKQNMIYKRTID